MRSYYVSMAFATVGIDVDEDGIIRRIAPIFWRWRKKLFEDFLDHFKESIERCEELSNTSPETKS